MGHTNSTANLSLPQFIGTDKPTWLGDVNGAFSAIDAYVGTNDAAVSAAASDASSAVSQAAAAVNTANTANTTAGNASTAANNAVGVANNAVGVANNAVAIAGVVDTKVGLLADLTTTDRDSIVDAINEVNSGLITPGVTAIDCGTITLTANTVEDVTVDTSAYPDFKAIIGTLLAGATQGAQYITCNQTDSKKFRLISTVTQNVHFFATILRF